MPQPTDRCNFINFPTIAAGTISTRLRGRNIDRNRGTGRRRITPSRGSGTYSDEVIWLLGSAYIAILSRPWDGLSASETHHGTLRAARSMLGFTLNPSYASPRLPGEIKKSTICSVASVRCIFGRPPHARRSACDIVSPHPEERPPKSGKPDFGNIMVATNWAGCGFAGPCGAPASVLTRAEDARARDAGARSHWKAPTTCPKTMASPTIP